MMADYSFEAIQLRSAVLDHAERLAAAAASFFPPVLNRPRLEVLADVVLATVGLPHEVEGHLAALFACNALALSRPGEVSETVLDALSLGPGVSGAEIDGWPAYFTFSPRPDRVADLDQQTGFAESSTNGVAFCLGGNGSGTTTSVLAKAVRFMLENEPVRRDCPFWLIAGSYEQICSLYDEKLDQKGHLPPSCIDRKRIGWLKPNNNWPMRVPLRPAEGSKNNWMLEFKSYEQGRQQMQARAIGGFAFIEQFPWELLTEVRRGCREFSMKSYRGNKLAEFTPVDPALSSNLEEMIRFGKAPADRSRRIRGAQYLPDNWEVFYQNTAIAAEAGHVDPDWFEEFCAMIPDDMIDVRIRGMFGSYEGLIYKGLNPSTHFVNDSFWSHVTDDVVRHRSIDWGSGPENPFCCLWGLRFRDGRWLIYDEYYSNDQESTTIDHLTAVHKRHEWRDTMLFGYTFADPSDPDNFRIGQKLPLYTNDTVDSMALTAAANAVNEGIEHVKYLFKSSLIIDDPANPTEKSRVPRLYIHEANCPNLSRELRSYRWEKSTGKGANPKSARKQPLKLNDHSVDALRYLVFTHDRSTGATIATASRRGEEGTAGDLVRRDQKTGWRKTLKRK
jgi:hypothetical protein